jgi:hypothetical protein
LGQRLPAGDPDTASVAIGRIERRRMTGPLASTAGPPPEWWEVPDTPLRRALLALECAHRMDASTKLTPQQARLIREHIIEARRPVRESP